METYTYQFDAFGEPIRRVMLERLRQGPLPVGELARGLQVSRPAVSQHLRSAEAGRAGAGRGGGYRRFYQLDRKGFEALRSYFDSFWGEALESFKARIEDE